jgi:benzoyl-CoA 2,3-dioxygenase component B
MRVVERTAQVMKEQKKDHPEDVRRLGLVDLPTVQRFLNLWFSVSVDLFGGEISSNAATSFAAGLKGRAQEERYQDHRALSGSYGVPRLLNGAIATEDVPLRNAMNEMVRDTYIEDCQRGVDRWNKAIAAHGIPFELKLPSRRFHRAVGVHAGLHFDPEGNPISAEAWEKRKEEWLPTAADRAHLASLMREPVMEPGKMANWIAAPKQGIKGRPVDFEYVRPRQA